MIIGIVAVASDWGIGKKNGLLFSLKHDMEHFKANTANHIVVCGENTLLSFPNQKPLKGRSTIVLCPEGHEYDNCICIHSFDELIKTIKVLSITNEIFIIGGGMLYASMLPYYDMVLVTKVNAVDPEATVFFPNLDELPQFKIDNSSIDIEDNGYIIKYVTYIKI